MQNLKKSVVGAIEKASRDLLDAVNASDAERVARLWSDDGVLMPPHRERVEGRESIRSYFARLFSASRLRYQFTSSRAWFAPDTAWQQVDYTAEIVPIAGGHVRSDRGQGLHLFRRATTGSWLLAVDIWNSHQPFAVPGSSPRSMTLTVLPGRFAIHRGAPDMPAPPVDGEPLFLSISRTPNELSIVAAETITLDGFQSDGGWRCVQVLGPLAFGEVGILASLATTLAAAGVSIFAVSTYDTDYLLIKDSAFDRAADALKAAGHHIRAA
jgi:uncharacterized protein (TIGR02246 family)